MKTTLQRLERRLHRSDQGNTLVMVTLFVTALFGFVALSFDVGNVFREQRRLQLGTDAAALAGVAKLGNFTSSASAQTASAVGEADAIANANGVTDAEVAAGAHGGFPGEIQVGRWDPSVGVFIPLPAASPPYNAVRVPGRRTVSLSFAPVIGPSVMQPAAHSVAEIGTKGVPVGVTTGAVATALSSGGTLTVSGATTGNWGPLQLCDGTLNGENDVEGAITAGDCFITLGETGDRTGFAGVQQGFHDRLNAGVSDPTALEVVIPIVDFFGTGTSTPSTVLDVMLARIISISGNGNNFTMTLFIEQVGLGALTSRQNRILVE